MVALLLQLLLLVFGLLAETGRAVTFSSRLIHRFSEEEVKALEVSRGGGANATRFWPAKRSAEYYQLLVASDFWRQRMKLGTRYELLFPSEGGKAMSLGNDFGWLHYTWIDVGTPNVAFLVALDAGSDLLWLPCECVQCAPLSASYYDSLDRDLNEYSPSASSTSKHLTCNHQLCELRPDCKIPKESCPYIVNYYSANTSTSGFLVQDVLHLASSNNGRLNHSVKAPVILGETYIVGVEASCIGNSCLSKSGFNALVDSGASFTFIPNAIYERIADEFDRRVNATRSNIEGSPWKYCYESSTKEKAEVPSLTLVFPLNNSFVVHDPVFLIYGMEGVTAFCLAIQPADEDVGTIGHNFMTGYRMVFDRENLKLGWSRSNCQDLEDGESMPLSPNARPPNPLPTNEQESSPQGHVVAPAVAGRAPSSASAAAPKVIATHFCMLRLLLPLLLLHLRAHYHPLYSRTR